MTNTLITDRRSLLAGGVAAMTLAIPAQAVALPIDRSEWERAFARMRTIEADDAAFTPGWWETWQRCKAECDKVPHVTFPPEAYSGGQRQTTADTFEVSRARKDVAALDAGKMRLDPLPGLHEHYEIKRELVKAADAREQQIQAVRDRYGMDAADERAEELGDLLAEAGTVLMDTPAPDLAALRWKLDHITGEAKREDGSLASYTSSYMRQTLDDIARLLPSAR